MSGPVYCILSRGNVHCIPVTAFNNANEELPDKLARSPPIHSMEDVDYSHPPRSQASISIKKKNILYTLNNPSLSDLESDVSRRFSTGSHTQDEEEAVFDSQFLRFASQKLTSEPLEDDLLCKSIGSMNGRKSDDFQTELSQKSQSFGFKSPNSAFKLFARNNLVDIDSGEDNLGILQDYSTHAAYLPQFFVDLQGNLGSNFTQMKTLLTMIFPSWSGSINIMQLTGGITNMLLSCSHPATNETLLMRVYGHGTNLIIDRNREFISHLVLNSLKLAPPIHARFENGTIYGYLPGRSLDPHELSKRTFYPLIAQQLGNWHKSINCEYIEDGVNTIRKYMASFKKPTDKKSPNKFKSTKSDSKSIKSVSDIWELIEDWIQIVPQNEALASIFRENTSAKDVSIVNVREIVLKEFNWLKRTLKSASRSPVVVCHCDLLSGNIIVSSSTDSFESMTESEVQLPPLEKNPIQFIDYEYMLPAPRGFDIANHFAEWQGFNCNRSAIPEPSISNPVMVTWCKGYLNDANASEEAVSKLIDEIACYYGMPGFYWGIWAMIQNELSNIDFNYADYSKSRFEEYWMWKKRFSSLHE